MLYSRVLGHVIFRPLTLHRLRRSTKHRVASSDALPIYTCADLSPKLVGIAKDRIEGNHLDDRITAQQADAQDLSKFDVRRPLPASWSDAPAAASAYLLDRVCLSDL